MSEATRGGRPVPLRTIALEWTRIGVTGFGAPPTHIALLRQLVGQRKRWIEEQELEDAIAACNMLPGPASTQLAIFCARRLAGPLGAVVGGLTRRRNGYVSSRPLCTSTPEPCSSRCWVPQRSAESEPVPGWPSRSVRSPNGGGFVIVPLMQGDAVHTYRWMSSAQFLSAVAPGQVTPGPVVATVAAVGYAARRRRGVLAAAVAFSPSFAFVLLGSGYFQRLRSNARARAFLGGAGPAAIGAILGAAISLAGALRETWQVLLLRARRSRC